MFDGFDEEAASVGSSFKPCLMSGSSWIAGWEYPIVSFGSMHLSMVPVSETKALFEGPELRSKRMML
jgi:hypothetical protein